MGQIVIVAYRPKPGREGELEALTREHTPLLRSLGLATDRPATTMLSRDGVVVEVFEWREGGMQAAHEHPQIHALWARYAEVCDYVPLQQVAETADLFPSFKPLD